MSIFLNPNASTLEQYFKGGDGDDATEGMEEEGEVEGEGDAIIILAGDAVIVEEHSLWNCERDWTLSSLRKL